MSIGVYDGDMMDIRRTKLKTYMGIYLPPFDYYNTCPLPHEWIHIFNSIPDYTPILQKKKFPFLVNHFNRKKQHSLDYNNTQDYTHSTNIQ